MKRMNLVEDYASWKCWEIELRSLQNYFSFVLLRRKFIPPLMDTFQDILVMTFGTHSTRELNLDVADSIHSKSITNEKYEKVLQQKADALIMDEETAGFYQMHLNIVPKH